MKLKLTALEQEVEKEDALRERKLAALLEERRAAQQDGRDQRKAWGVARRAEQDKYQALLAVVAEEEESRRVLAQVSSSCSVFSICSPVLLFHLK